MDGTALTFLLRYTFFFFPNFLRQVKLYKIETNTFLAKSENV